MGVSWCTNSHTQCKVLQGNSFRDPVISEVLITALYSSFLPPLGLGAMHQSTYAPTAWLLQPNGSQRAVCGRGFHITE